MSPDLHAEVMNLQKLDGVPFFDFIMMHKIQPKIYMLKCDKNIDAE